MVSVMFPKKRVLSVDGLNSQTLILNTNSLNIKETVNH